MSIFTESAAKTFLDRIRRAAKRRNYPIPEPVQTEEESTVIFTFTEPSNGNSASVRISEGSEYVSDESLFGDMLGSNVYWIEPAPNLVVQINRVIELVFTDLTKGN